MGASLSGIRRSGVVDVRHTSSRLLDWNLTGGCRNWRTFRLRLTQAELAETRRGRVLWRTETSLKFGPTPVGRAFTRRAGSLGVRSACTSHLRRRRVRLTHDGRRWAGGQGSRLPSTASKAKDFWRSRLPTSVFASGTRPSPHEGCRRSARASPMIGSSSAPMQTLSRSTTMRRFRTRLREWVRFWDRRRLPPSRRVGAPGTATSAASRKPISSRT